jgi:hypothetical protein
MVAEERDEIAQERVREDQLRRPSSRLIIR